MNESKEVEVLDEQSVLLILLFIVIKKPKNQNYLILVISGTAQSLKTRIFLEFKSNRTHIFI